MTLLTLLKNPPAASSGMTFLAGTPAESTASVTTLTPSITFTGGLQDGDWILLICASNSSTGGFTSIPSGYLALVANEDTDAASGSTAGHHAIFYRKWVSGDTDPVVTFASGRAGILPVRVRGADPTDLTGVGPAITKTTAAGTAVSAPTLTPVEGTVLATTFMGRSNSSTGTFITWTAPAGMTEIGEAGGKSATQTNASSMLAVMPVTVGTPTGVQTATASSTATGAMGVSFILKPAQSGSARTGAASFSGGSTLSATGVALTGGGGGGGALATITPQGTPTMGEAGSAALTADITYPTGIVAGEVLLLEVVASANGVNATPPTGWTLASALQNTTAGTSSSAIFYRVANGTETGTLTVSPYVGTANAATGGRITLAMQRWSGVDTTNVLDTAGVTSGTGNALTYTHPSITTVTNGAVVVYHIALNSSTGTNRVTTSAGPTQIGSGPTANVGREGQVFYETQATAGAVGTRLFSNGGLSAQWGGNSIALRPGPQTGGGTGTITYAGAGTYFAATAANWAVPYPSGVTANDFLLLFASSGGAQTSAPTGWSVLHDEDVVANPKGGLYYKIATGSESGTVTIPTSSAIGGAQMFRYTGVDPAAPIDVTEVAVQNTLATLTIDLPAITTLTANATLIYAGAANSGTVTMTSATGTERVDIGALGGGRAGALYDEVIATPGDTGARTITISGSRENWGTMVALRPLAAGSNRTASVSLSGSGTLTAAGAALTGGTNSAFVFGSGSLSAAGVIAGSTPTLVHRIVGVPTSTSQTVSARVTNATSVRLKVSTDAAGTTGVVFGTPVTPSALGDVKLPVTGLTPGTNYYYRIAMTGASGEALDSHAVVGRLRTAPVGQANFAFNFASCNTSADGDTMATVAARGDDLFFHLGDLYYADASGTTLANFRSKFAAKVAATNHTAVFSTTPTSYTPSDHDGMNNNTTNGDDPTAWANWRTVYNEIFPAPSTYYSFTYGRVQFIQIDDRNFKTIASATDNSSKTALGATQKQWLKDQITNSTASAIVIAQSSPYIDTATAGEDGWGGYVTERTELANFFAASGKNIVMLGGDMHALAADDGTNAPGGITVFQAAPLYTTSSWKGGPYTVGPYPAAGVAATQQYGHVDVTDTGTQISFAYTGYSSDNIARVTLTKNFTATPPTVNYTGSASFSGSGTLTASAVTVGRTGSASLTGSGTLTATGTAATSRAVALTGSGTLTASGTAATTASAALTGSGTLSAVATGMSHSRSAAFTGSGTLGTQTSLSGSASASLTGSGALTAVAVTVGRTGSVSLSGSGTLSSASTVDTSGTASLTGSGTLTSAQIVGTSGSTNLTGSGTLTATGGVVAVGSASLTGSGTLTASGAVSTSNSLALTGSGTLTAAATGMSHSRSASFSGSGTLGFQTTVQGSASASLTGSGILSATGDVRSLTGSASFTGSGTLSSTRTVATSGNAALTGSGTLTASGTLVSAVSVSLTGSGTLTTTVGAVSRTGDASFTGSGTLTAVAGAVSRTGAANFSGSGSLAPTVGALAVTGAAVLTGSGTLGTQTSVSGTASASLSGSGTLSTSVGVIGRTGSASLTGSGTLTAVATTVSATQNVSLSGSGALTSAVVANMATSAGLSGSGNLTTASTPSVSRGVSFSGSGTLGLSATGLALSGAATLTGSGTLTPVATGMGHTATVTLSGSGTLSPSTATSGAVSANFSGSGTLSVSVGNVSRIVSVGLTGSGTLGGLATLVTASRSAAFSGSGTLSAQGSTAGTISAGFSGSGTLSAAVSVVGASGTGVFGGSGSVSSTISGLNIIRAVSTSGSGTLSASAVAVSQSGSANFSGSGTLGYQTSSVSSGSASLSGSGTLSSARTPAFSRTVGLTGTGTLSAVATSVTQSVSTSFSGTGTLATQSATSGTVVAFLSGTGTLTAAASTITTGTAVFSGSGVLSATGTPVAKGSMSSTGQGTLTVATNAVLVKQNVGFSGSGSLSSAAKLTASGVADFSGVGGLAAGTRTDSAAAVFTDGEGTLSATGKPVTQASVGMSGAGALTVTTSVAVASTVALLGSGVLESVAVPTASGIVEFDGSGTLRIFDATARADWIDFSGSGTLSAVTRYIPPFDPTPNLEDLEGVIVPPDRGGELESSPYATSLDRAPYDGVILDTNYERFSGKLVEDITWWFDILERE